MLKIESIPVLKDYLEKKGYVIRNKVDATAYDGLFFTLIGPDNRFFNCYTDISKVIDYIYLIG